MNIGRGSVFFAAALLVGLSAFGDVVINEVQCANDKTLTIQIAKVSAVGGKVDDEPDWVELYNNGDTAVDLSGWGFSDKESKRFKFKFPKGATIAAGGYLLLIADEREQSEDATTGAPTRYHIPISLSTDGETLFLTSKDSSYSHTVTFGMLPCDTSCGFASNGTPIYYATPTPEAANSVQTYSAPLAPVTFSQQRGLFTTGQEFDLTLSHVDPDAQIYYTIDHSDPDDATQAHGTRTLYTAPIRISGTTVVRATAEKSGALPYRNVTSHSYIYPDQVMQQEKPECAAPETGWWTDTTKYGYKHDGNPNWQNGSCHPSYKPSENVIKDAKSLADFVASIHAAPVVSVTMSDFAMFDPNTGLHSKPETYNNKADGERPASVEWVSGTGDSAPVFGLLAGLKMQGGWGRYFDGSSKKSFQLKFRKRYGKSKLQEDVLGAAGCPRKKFKSLILRAEFHDSWTESSISTQPRGSNMKDEFWRELSKPVLGYAVWGSHVHLYINGLYWGLYNLTEHADEDLAAEIGGGEGDDYVMMKNKAAGKDNLDVISGDKTQYFGVATPLWQAGVNYQNAVKGGQSLAEASESCLTGNADMSVRANYESAAAFFDVDNLIAYMHLGYMSGNWDWPANNWNVFGIPGKNVPFRWMVWDFETTCESKNDDNFKLVEMDSNSAFTGNPGHITKVLLKSPEFRMKFADKFDELTKAGGPLSTESLVSRYQTLAAEVRPRIFAEAARWGSYWAENDPTADQRFANLGGHGLSAWDAERTRVLEQVLPKRVEVVRAQLQSEGVYPQNAKPATATLAGDGKSLTLSLAEQAVNAAPKRMLLAATPAADTIYYTTDGSDPCDVWASGGAQAVGTPYTGQTITSPVNAVVKARVLTADGEWSTLTTANLKGTESDSWYEFLPTDNGKNWSEPENWSKGEVPNAADAQVRIGVPTAVKSGKGWRNVHLDQDATVGTLVFTCGGWTNRLDEAGNLTLGGAGAAATVQVADNSGAGLAMFDLDGKVTFANNVTFDVANSAGDAGYGAFWAQGELDGNGKALVKTGAGKMSFGFAGATNEQALGSIAVNAGTLAIYKRVTVTGAITGAAGTTLELEINKDGDADDTAIRDVTCATLDVPAVRLFLKSNESGTYVGGCHAADLPTLDKVTVFVRDDENGTVPFKDNHYSPVDNPDLRIVNVDGKKTYQVIYDNPDNPDDPPVPPQPKEPVFPEGDDWGYTNEVAIAGTDYMVVVFTNTSKTLSMTLPSNVSQIDYLVVGGGGGGGYQLAGGGGGGGFKEGNGVSVSAGAELSVEVGAGGAGGAGGTPKAGGSGGESSLTFAAGDQIVAGGGGGGGTYTNSAGEQTGANGVNGSSGGGGGRKAKGGNGSDGAGKGGAGDEGGYGGAGGGGGAGGDGAPATGGAVKDQGVSGNGGAGKSSSITGETLSYAGGGGGGGGKSNNGVLAGGKGQDHGGNGAGYGSTTTAAASGEDGFGGGGGGGGNSTCDMNGGRGGDGVVIIRYALGAAPQPQERGSVLLTCSNYKGSTTLGNFPMLVRISPTAIPGFSYDGLTSSQISFKDSNGNELSCEVDTWNPSGESLVWVKVPSLTATTTVTLCWGKERTTESADVWTAYLRVCHLNGDLTDATGNGTIVFDGADSSKMNFSSPNASKFGSGVMLQTSAGSLLDGGDTKASFYASKGATLSGWYRVDEWTGTVKNEKILGWGNWNGATWGGFYLQTKTSENIETVSLKATSSGSASQIEKFTRSGLMNGLHHVAVTYGPSPSGDTSRGWVVWLDGVEVKRSNYTEMTDSSSPIVLMGNLSYVRYLDEFRASDDIKSSDWVLADYQQQASVPGLLYKVGAQLPAVEGREITNVSISDTTVTVDLGPANNDVSIWVAGAPTDLGEDFENWTTAAGAARIFVEVVAKGGAVQREYPNVFALFSDVKVVRFFTRPAYDATLTGLQGNRSAADIGPYINTGYKPNLTDKLVADLTTKKDAYLGDEYETVFSARKDNKASDKSMTVFICHQTTGDPASTYAKRFRFDYGTYNTANPPKVSLLVSDFEWSLNTQYEVVLDGNMASVTDKMAPKSVKTPAESGEAQGTLVLFAARADSSGTVKPNHIGKFTLHSFQWYGSDGKLKHNYIPVHSAAGTNTVYDAVEGKLLPVSKAGTGAGNFGAGEVSSTVTGALTVSAPVIPGERTITSATLLSGTSDCKVTFSPAEQGAKKVKVWAVADVTDMGTDGTNVWSKTALVGILETTENWKTFTIPNEWLVSGVKTLRFLTTPVYDATLEGLVGAGTAQKVGPYIDTGFTPHLKNNKVVIDFTPGGSLSGYAQAVATARKTWDSGERMAVFLSTEGKIRVDYQKQGGSQASGQINESGWQTGTDYVATFDGGNRSVTLKGLFNNVEATKSYTDQIDQFASDSLLVFATHSAGEIDNIATSHVTVHNVCVYGADGETVVHDYIPVVADGVNTLYDTVGDEVMTVLKAGTETGNFGAVGTPTPVEPITWSQTVSVDVPPVEKDLRYCTVTCRVSLFNGNAQSPVLTVKDGTTTLREGTDYTYTVSGGDGTTRTNAGTYTITLNGAGEYSGSTTVNWEIEAAEIDKVTLAATSADYTGQPHQPEVVSITSYAGVVIPATAPAWGDSVAITYSRNGVSTPDFTSPGLITVTASAASANCTGSASATFAITSDGPIKVYRLGTGGTETYLGGFSLVSTAVAVAEADTDGTSYKILVTAGTAGAPVAYTEYHGYIDANFPDDGTRISCKKSYRFVGEGTPDHLDASTYPAILSNCVFEVKGSGCDYSFESLRLEGRSRIAPGANPGSLSVGNCYVCLSNNFSHVGYSAAWTRNAFIIAPRDGNVFSGSVEVTNNTIICKKIPRDQAEASRWITELRAPEFVFANNVFGSPNREDCCGYTAIYFQRSLSQTDITITNNVFYFYVDNYTWGGVFELDNQPCDTIVCRDNSVVDCKYSVTEPLPDSFVNASSIELLCLESGTAKCNSLDLGGNHRNGYCCNKFTAPHDSGTVQQGHDSGDNIQPVPTGLVVVQDPHNGVCADGTTLDAAHYCANCCVLGYCVTLDPNGGTWPDETTTSKAQTFPTLFRDEPQAHDPFHVVLGVDDLPAKDGMLATGWTDDATGMFYTREQLVGLTVEATKSYTAQYTVTVTFNANGGTIPDGGKTSVAVSCGEQMPALAAGDLPTREGNYVFAGYFDAQTGGKKYYNRDGSSAATWDKTEATTLYAQWIEGGPIRVFRVKDASGEPCADIEIGYGYSLMSIAVAAAEADTGKGYKILVTGGTADAPVAYTEYHGYIDANFPDDGTRISCTKSYRFVGEGTPDHLDASTYPAILSNCVFVVKGSGCDYSFENLRLEGRSRIAPGTDPGSLSVGNCYANVSNQFRHVAYGNSWSRNAFIIAPRDGNTFGSSVMVTNNTIICKRVPFDQAEASRWITEIKASEIVIANNVFGSEKEDEHSGKRIIYLQRVKPNSQISITNNTALMDTSGDWSAGFATIEGSGNAITVTVNGNSVTDYNYARTAPLPIADFEGLSMVKVNNAAAVVHSSENKYNGYCVNKSGSSYSAESVIQTGHDVDDNIQAVPTGMVVVQDPHNGVCADGTTLDAAHCCTNCCTLGYRVTFDPNGGSPTPDPQYVAKQFRDETYPDAPVTEPTGVTKGGNAPSVWVVEGTGAKWNFADAVTGSMTLKAVYTVTVTFNANGGDTPDPATKDVVPGAAYGTLATCSRTGYTFAGWYTEATDGSEVTAETIVTATADHPLYAHWTPNQYTVTINKGTGVSTAYYQIGSTSGTWTKYTAPFDAPYGQTVYAYGTAQQGYTVDQTMSNPASKVVSTTGNSIDLTATGQNYTIYFKNYLVDPMQIDNYYCTIGVKLEKPSPLPSAVGYRLYGIGAYDNVEFFGPSQLFFDGAGNTCGNTKDGYWPVTYWSGTALDYIWSKEVAVPSPKTGLVYTGSPLTGVEATTGCTVTDGQATDAGTYIATATLEAPTGEEASKKVINHIWASDKTTAAKTVEFTIAPKSIATASVKTQDKYWTGAVIVPPLTVDGRALQVGTDYDWSIGGAQTNTQVGAYSVDFTGLNNYEGSTMLSWKIQRPVYTWGSLEAGTWGTANWTCNASSSYMDEHDWHWPQMGGHMAYVTKENAVIDLDKKTFSVCGVQSFAPGVVVKNGTLDFSSSAGYLYHTFSDGGSMTFKDMTLTSTKTTYWESRYGNASCTFDNVTFGGIWRLRFYEVDNDAFVLKNGGYSLYEIYSKQETETPHTHRLEIENATVELTYRVYINDLQTVNLAMKLGENNTTATPMLNMSKSGAALNLNNVSTFTVDASAVTAAGRYPLVRSAGTLNPRASALAALAAVGLTAPSDAALVAEVVANGDTGVDLVVREKSAVEPTIATSLLYNAKPQNGYTSQGTHVTLSGTTSATDADTYTFTATPEEGYAWSDGTYGTKTYTWTIAPKSIEYGWTKNVYWTSEPITPPLILYVGSGDKTLVWGTDYTVKTNSVLIETAEEMPVDVNPYSVTFTGKGNFSGEITKNWSIIPPTYTWDAGVDGDWATASWSCDAPNYMEDHNWYWPQGAGHAAVIDGHTVALTGGDVTNVTEKLTLKNGASIKDGTIEVHSWTIDMTSNGKTTVFEDVHFVAKGRSYTIVPNTNAEVELRGDNKFESNGSYKPYLQFQHDKANSVMRFKDGTTDHTHMQINFYDTTHTATDLIPKTIEITNAVLKVNRLIPTKIDPVLLTIALGENNAAQSEAGDVAPLKSNGDLRMPVGSKLTVDAGQKGVGTYPLVRFGIWNYEKAGDMESVDSFIATATADGKVITGVADGLLAKVVKTSDGKGIDLVVYNPTVTLDPNGGTIPDGGKTSVAVAYGEEMPALVAGDLPTREGNYAFAGYFDAQTGGTKYYNWDGSSAAIWDKTEATTLYAQWNSFTAVGHWTRWERKDGEDSTVDLTATKSPDVTVMVGSTVIDPAYYDVYLAGCLNGVTNGLGQYTVCVTGKSEYAGCNATATWNYQRVSYSWTGGGDGTSWTDGANWTCSSDVGAEYKERYPYPQSAWGHSAEIKPNAPLTVILADSGCRANDLAVGDGVTFEGGRLTSGVRCQAGTADHTNHVVFSGVTIDYNRDVPEEPDGNKAWPSISGQAYVQLDFIGNCSITNSSYVMYGGTSTPEHGGDYRFLDGEIFAHQIQFNRSGTEVVDRFLTISNSLVTADQNFRMADAVTNDAVHISFYLGERNKSLAQEADAAPVLKANDNWVSFSPRCTFAIDATEKGVGRYPLFRSKGWNEGTDLLKRTEVVARATEGVKVASGLVGRVVLTEDKKGFDLVVFHKGLILFFGPAN